MEQQKIVLTENINIDVFGYSYDQGWMCVQVFFVRQGKLIERDVSIFPFYKDSKETFISFIGKFYLKEDNLKHMQIILIVDTEVELVNVLLDIDDFLTLREMKKVYFII